MIKRRDHKTKITYRENKVKIQYKIINFFFKRYYNKWHENNIQNYSRIPSPNVKEEFFG